MKTFLLRHLAALALASGALTLAPAAQAQSQQEPATLSAFVPVEQPATPLLAVVADAERDSSADGRIRLLDLRVRRLSPDAIGVVLYWTIAQEPEAGTTFAIERLDEGAAGYRRVALVPGQPSSMPYSYSFVDAGNASAQPSNYRLRRLSAADALGIVTAPQVVPGAIPGPPQPLDPEEALTSVAAQ